MALSRFEIHTLPLALVVTTALVLGAGPALAEDVGPATDTPQIADRIDAREAMLTIHLRANQIELVLEDIRLAQTLYQRAAASEEAQRDEHCARLVELIGGLTRARQDGVPAAALEALGGMREAASAKYVTRFLRPVSGADAPAAVVQAIRSAGQLADDRLVRPLLNIVRRSQNPEVAAEAIRALGNFDASERYRVRILRELVREVAKVAPESRLSRRDLSREIQAAERWDPQGPAARWAALAPALTESLNQLTGRTFHSPYDWIDAFEANKHRPDALFLDR
ncbi:MAG: HEAT repeat domain-containing protein [Planctomycetota bacterium]|jgi:hypothetical protein